MEACAIEVKGHAVREVTGLKSWYLTANPAEGNGELEQLALQKTEFDHVSVGVWFARTEAYPSGWYWVVVLPEHSAVHEAVWSHFYLTDDFEYQTIFSKRWKANLPKECRTILNDTMCGLANFALDDRVAFSESQKPFHHRGTETERKQLIGFLCDSASLW
jgi:hypothetical protein